MKQSGPIKTHGSVSCGPRKRGVRKRSEYIDVLSHMRILPVRVRDIPYAYTRTGCLYAYGMPIRVWDDIFTEALSY